MEFGDGIDDYVAVVALGLVAKACKQYRAIGEMVSLGLGEVADSNARMLFETMLAVDFIMRRRVALKRGAAPLPAVPGRPMTTKFRTSLYLAHDAFNQQKFVRGMLDTPGLRRKMSARIRNEINQVAADWEATIGPEWTERIDRTYSGVNIKDLAQSLGYGPYFPHISRELLAVSRSGT